MGCSYPRNQLSCVLWGDPFDECAERWGVLLVSSVLQGGCRDYGVVGGVKGGLDVVPEFGEVLYHTYLPPIGSVGEDLDILLICPHIDLLGAEVLCDRVSPSHGFQGGLGWGLGGT